METYSINLAKSLDRLATVQRVVLRGRRDGRAPSPWALGLFLCRAAVVVLRQARRHDVLIVGDFVLAPLVLLHRLAAPGARRVVIVHGLDLLFGKQPGFRPRLYALYTRLVRNRIRRAATILANSRVTAKVALSMGFDDVKVVPLGVDLRPLDAEHVDRRDRHMVLFVGRVIARKGPGWFVESVLPILPDTRFVAVGPTVDHDELDRIIRSDNAEYLGLVEPSVLEALRHRAWLAVMPNIPSPVGDVEGFGLAALEAAAAGCVVIGADTEGVSDALEDGVTGVVVAPGDAEGWASAIREIQSWEEDRYRAFVDRARERINGRFSWDRVARDVLNAAGY